MQEMQVWFLSLEDPLAEKMATRSHILVWEITWTEEPGSLQSMWSQRVWIDWSNLAGNLPSSDPSICYMSFFFFLVLRVLVTLLCLTLYNPMDYSPLGSSVHGISQARILDWVPIPFSRGPSQSRDWTHVSCIAGRFFAIWATREAPLMLPKFCLLITSPTEIWIQVSIIHHPAPESILSLVSPPHAYTLEDALPAEATGIFINSWCNLPA